ncbi:Chitin synthase, class 3 [Naganishia friedmannii]|uniref:Chitin synthase, class 3 n=1 Tax=Naganishia friedmannii TaxID=89922 RepID=A0ACC2V297_9TREE|nr:Chitin synthase, class 3 [Naganishia friedmannii]
MSQPNRPPPGSQHISFDSQQHPRYTQQPSSSTVYTTSSASKGAYGKPPLPTQSSSGSIPGNELGYATPPHLARNPASGGIGGLLGIGQPGGPGGGAADMRRKKSLVRPDRERIDPNHRLWHYREHAAAAAEGGRPAGYHQQTDAPQGYPQQQQQQQQQQPAGGMRGNVQVLPSTTGNAPPGLRRGKSILAREPNESASESGLNFLKRGPTLRRKSTNTVNKEYAGAAGGRGPTATSAGTGRSAVKDFSHSKRDDEGVACLGNFVPGPKNWWMIYCYLLTICIPNFVLKNVGGKSTPEAQRAWREKIGLVSINAFLMAAVGFITFGFTQTVCSSTGVRIQGGKASNASLIVNGYAYDLGNWNHPAAGSQFNGTQNPLFMDNWMAGGKDASFLFQKVNENCLNILTPSNSSAIPKDGNRMAWYFPCNIHDQRGTSAVNLTGYTDATNCHTSTKARSSFYDLKPQGEIYWSWNQVQNSSRNLAVYESSVLDLSLLQWLQSSQVSYPPIFDAIKTPNATYQGKDITMMMYRAGMKEMGKCLEDIARVGFVDTKSIGCVASDVVLYVSLVFILGVVAIKFSMAVIFGWFLSWRLGNFKGESYQQRMARAQEIENWTDDIYRPAPSRYRPSVPQNKGGVSAGAKKNAFLPTTSRFSRAEPMMVSGSRPSTAYGNVDQLAYNSGYGGRSRQASMYGMNKAAAAAAATAQGTPPGSPMLRSSRSSTSLPYGGRDDSRMNLADTANSNAGSQSACPFPLHNVISQPPPDYEPFNFPLMHTICLVTAYSESVEGLRTTLDSLATTDYPNSHKLILVIADGMVKGSGSKETTPDIVLGMMKDLIIPSEQVEPHSYVAIADGHKRHNMAKVYAGFYEYDNDTIEVSKQQRVPMVLVAKCGNPLEVNDAKPGNRGKRDSQIVLMAFLQKVMFDERMTTFEYEFFNSIWRVTGVSPDRYEGVLCVDADTKVFPDSLTRMIACLVHDEEIMGLCGETKIANKAETWVTMIQVFEYYISHHLTKAFESMFGGVTCLPGCFSMYRIKAPKGETGYWVPILANPDIVEHYSENIVDTLHKKNLLLLGEDRFLTTLMLKTFPKRKMLFCPQAVCKTVVPDTFRVLLSQRRRWINSTIHNLAELMLVRDLCGTFCFSMQFVVFMELVGTLVLPAAIAFTIYIIILAIIPGSSKPIISLILLAFILGLPGLLIVITSRKVAYVGWMLIYLLSLPIWNFVLPAYAFWHMDDFSWGLVRQIEGETGKSAGHGDKEGEFDSTQIVMKRWVEFERERRWKSGTQSRDSYYDVVQRSSSPKSRDGLGRDRYSVVSTNETYMSGGASSDVGLYKNSQSFGSMSNQTQSPDFNTLYAGGPFRGNGGRDASPGSSDSHENSGYVSYGYEAGGLSGHLDEEQPILPAFNQAVASPQLYAQTPRRQPSFEQGNDGFGLGGARSPPALTNNRRVSLRDDGPTDFAEPIVRRVPRSSSKRASFTQQSGYQSQPQQTYRGVASPSNTGSTLPPGAVSARGHTNLT